jgi:aminodeoxyfutalosine synthase
MRIADLPSFQLQDQRLLPLMGKLLAGLRLGFEDGLLLYETADLTGVGVLANHVRMRMSGKKTYFARSRRLSYTNICQAKCKFCAFHSPHGASAGYALNPEAAIEKLRELGGSEPRELHIVGGHNPDLKIEYFESLFLAIKSNFPNVRLKAFTMVEIAYYAKNSGISAGEFLARCRAAGLAACPGGGAEIFDEEIRKQICPDKGNADTWIETAKLCHKMGIYTNCSMLYGHIENAGHKVAHLLRLRQANDESLSEGLVGFDAYIPLAFQAKGNELAKARKIPQTTGVQDLREIAVGRLLLDNVPHVKAYWVMITPGLAQVALSYGADDLDGTADGEEIARAAGSNAPSGLCMDYLCRLITEAGFEPVERD